MKVCIIGGGTAGWLTAFLLIHRNPIHSYHVIEDAEQGAIGVGEGSTGLFGSIINEYNIDVVEFMCETDALPKLGIRFTNWTGDGSSFDASLAGTMRTAYGDALIDSAIAVTDVSQFKYNDAQLESALSSRNLTHFYKNDEGGLSSVFDFSHAWHFDGYKVGEFFKNKCMTALDSYNDAKVISVDHHGDTVKSVTMSNGKKMTADLFIDCSGLNAVIPTALGRKRKLFSDTLPTNSAFLFTPEVSYAEKIPNTSAIAMDNGWVFEIPTRNKIGRGYIYCDQFADDDSIKSELQDHYGCDINHSRTIKFEANRLEDSAFGNVLVTGLAASFFEPLQATSIHNTIMQVVAYSDGVLREKRVSDIDQELVAEYNRRMNTLFDDTASFIALHYECGRTDTNFWDYVTNKKPKDKETSRLLSLAKKRLMMSSDFRHYYFGMIGQQLWSIIMHGMGMIDKDTIRQSLKDKRVNIDFEVDILQRGLDNLLGASQHFNLMTQNQLDKFIGGQSGS